MRNRPRKHPTLNQILGSDSSEADLRRYPVLADIIESRNISNTEEIEKYIKEFHVDSARVNDWLDSTLRKFLINKYDKTESYRPKPSDPEWMKGKSDIMTVLLDDALTQKIQHVVHFLEDKETSDPSFKIKFLQAEEAFKQADQWTKSLQKKKMKKEGEGTDYNILKDAGDGFFWADLISRNATAAEGNKMGHCVGGEGYWSAIQAGRTKIISLRDSSNDPHATIEYSVNDKIVRQIKGKQNKGVVGKYMPYVLEFLSNPPVPIKDVSDYELRLNGLIKAKNGYLSLRNLPDGASLSGNFDLTKFPDEIPLPSNLTVEGDLILSEGATLKPNTTVGGELKVNPQTKELPSGLSVGSLDMFRSSLTQIPADIKITDNLNAEFSQLKSIPSLNLSGDLTLSDSFVSAIPENTSVGGELDIMNTSIKVLPESLQVGKAIFVDDEDEMQIPNHLKSKVY